MKLKIKLFIGAIVVIIALIITVYFIINSTMPKSNTTKATRLKLHKTLPDSRKYYFLTPSLDDNEPNSDGYYEERF